MSNKIAIWERIFSLIQMATGNVDVTNKGDLQTQVDDLDEMINRCFTATGIVDIKNKGDLQTQVDDLYINLIEQIKNLDINLKNCFLYASSGKELIANAITGKGIPTTGIDMFATMAENIKKIKTTPTLQSKSTVLDTRTTYTAMSPDNGYDGLSQATASISLQEKTAALSTVAQNIIPDNGKVLSKVVIPAVGGTANAGDVLLGKTFSSASGVNETGTMPNRGAWTGSTTDNSKVPIPSGYHNGEGYVDGSGAYNKGVADADARANSDSDNYKAGYNAGVSDTKKGTAGTGDVLTGKTFTNASSVGASGTMANKGGITVEAGAITQDDDYTYFAIPVNGYYNTDSKLSVPNNKIGLGTDTIDNKWESIAANTAKTVQAGQYYMFYYTSSDSSATRSSFTGATTIKDICKSISRQANVNTYYVNFHVAILYATGSTLKSSKEGYICLLNSV